MQNIQSNDRIQMILDERRGLPCLLRAPHRLITGVPDLDAKMTLSGPLWELAKDLGLLVAFAVLAGLAASLALAGIPWVLPIAGYAVLGTGGRLRKLTVAHKHEGGGHGVGFDIWRRNGIDETSIESWRMVLADTCAIVSLSKSAAQYRLEHPQHHDLSKLGTLADPEGALVHSEGFHPGMTLAFRYHLLALLFNPFWYAAKTVERLCATLFSRGATRRLSGAVFVCALLGMAWVLPTAAWWGAIGLPWLIVYPAASLLQVLSEHPYGAACGAKTLQQYAERTWERIPWDMIPVAASPIGWARWTFRLLFLHIPTRLAVLDRTMIWHGFHHLAWEVGRPFDDWWNTHYHFLAAWKDGVLPVGWNERLLCGLDEALTRQADRMIAKGKE